MPDNPSFSGVKHIIFDFGGVLFDIDYALPIQAFARLGYADFGHLYAQAAQNQWFDDLETGRISNEQFYAYLQTFVPHATHTQIVEAWNTILLHLRVEEVQFIQSLRDAGVRTFLLSNTNAIHVEVFEQMIDREMGLSTFRAAFETIYYSNVIGLKKPYPATFLEVCRWNDLEPSETLFIDDSIQHVEGARQAGLHVHHLLPQERISQLLVGFGQRP
jgi:putative hydrolase of the HAD superfamily